MSRMLKLHKILINFEILSLGDLAGSFQWSDYEIPHYNATPPPDEVLSAYSHIIIMSYHLDLLLMLIFNAASISQQIFQKKSKKFSIFNAEVHLLDIIIYKSQKSPCRVRSAYTNRERPISDHSI